MTFIGENSLLIIFGLDSFYVVDIKVDHCSTINNVIRKLSFIFFIMLKVHMERDYFIRDMVISKEAFNDINYKGNLYQTL